MRGSPFMTLNKGERTVTRGVGGKVTNGHRLGVRLDDGRSALQAKPARPGSNFSSSTASNSGESTPKSARLSSSGSSKKNAAKPPQSERQARLKSIFSTQPSSKAASKPQKPHRQISETKKSELQDAKLRYEASRAVLGGSIQGSASFRHKAILDFEKSTAVLNRVRKSVNSEIQL